MPRNKRRPSGGLWTVSWVGDFDWTASGTSGEKRQPLLMVPLRRERRPIVLPYTPIGEIYAKSDFHFSALWKRVASKSDSDSNWATLFICNAPYEISIS
jgi:hypothetical protein